VSLHAPDDETRSKLMPVNNRYPISELMDACNKYFTKTGRRISYEYAIIDGVNDAPAQARKLAALIKGTPAHVNIIPCNPVAGKPYRPPKPETVMRFARELGELATVRRTLGKDIDAACGQLRSKRQC
jgi:23S rRNA (adenine2503-C2)-methyltransferase